MTTERFKIHAAVYLVLENDNKVLLLRRFNTGWADGQYSMVSGHLDGDEPATQAMCREAMEEAGITIRPEDLTLVHTMHHKGSNEYIDLYFTTQRWEGDPYNAEPEKCDDMQWFDRNALPENTLPYVKRVFTDVRQGIRYSEVGW